MRKIALLITLFLANVTLAHADAQMVIGRLASAPVQQFNQRIRQAHDQQQTWVDSFREVARRFVGHDEIPNRIHAQQLDHDLVLSVALDGRKNDMLYILTLYRSNNVWQMREAEMGWRCQGQGTFTPVPCP
ncbi:MAG: hypothetical protein ACRC8Q_05085 [Aeromonas sp.]